MVFSELKQRSFYNKTLHIMIPVMLQQLISVGINFLDTIMIGGLGEAAIAGVSLANEFSGIIMFIFMGLGSGANVMSSQYWGMGKTEPLKKVAAIALRLSLAISAVFLVLGITCPRGILAIFTNDAAVIEAGCGYMRLLSCTFIFYGMVYTVTYLLRSIGHVKIPLISSIIAFFLNLFFNWVFIFGKFGMPAMGAVGAAVGTVIARTFEFCFIFGYFVFKEKNYGFRLKHFFLSGQPLLKQYMKFSVPVLISDTLLGIGLSLVSVIIGHIGAEFTAANSIVNNGNRLLTVINTSMAGASAVVIGNTIGEGDRDKAYREGVAYVILSVSLGIVFSLILLALQNVYLSLYTITDSTYSVAKDLFLFIIIMSPIQTLAYVTSKGILRGGGDTRFLMIADIILLWAVSLPLGWLSGMVWHMTPFWINFFLKLEYGTKGLLCTWRFLSKKWIQRVE